MPLSNCVGRILRETVTADRPFPPFDRVTMDGIAIRWDEWSRGVRRFRIAAVAPAGSARISLESGPDPCCAEVMTGAVLPERSDCVVPVEQLSVSEGWATIAGDVVCRPSQNVHPAGTDIATGSAILHPGSLLGPPEIALCATVGLHEVMVSALPRVAIVATGDELVAVSGVPEPHQIRLSNIYAVEAALKRRGFTDVTLHHLSDEKTVSTERLAGILDAHDVVVLSGGVSAGAFDWVPGALERLQVASLFHRVAQRPGLPLWFGERPGAAGRDASRAMGDYGPGSAVTVFGLPGNPVSTTISTCRYVVPFLRACAGSTDERAAYARLADEVEFGKALTLFLPVALESGPDGVSVARPRPTHGSGDLAALAGTDGFVELKQGGGPVFMAGSAWRYYPW